MLARAVRDRAATLQRAVAFASQAPRFAPGVVPLQRAIDFEATSAEGWTWFAKNVIQAKAEFEEIKAWLQTAETLGTGESKAIRAFINAEIACANTLVKRWDSKKVSLADRETVISEIGVRIKAVRDVQAEVGRRRAREAEDARVAAEKEEENRRVKEERRRAQEQQEAANAEKRRLAAQRADEEKARQAAQDRLRDEQLALEAAQRKAAEEQARIEAQQREAAEEQARIEEAQRLEAEQEELARAAAAKRLTALTDARGRADQVDASVQASLSIIGGLGIFADDAEVATMRARGDAARAAAAAARALLVDDADPAAGDAQLATAESEAGTMAALAGAARAAKEAKEADIARALAEFAAAVAKLSGRAKAQMTPWLARLDGLSVSQRLASLEDPAIEGGIAAARNELATAKKVDGRLAALREPLRALMKDPLFAPVGQQMLDEFKGLEWSQVVESLDTEIGAGIMDLELAKSEAAKTVARTAEIEAAVAGVGLEPMRAHLTSALATKTGSWEAFVAHVEQLDRDLAFAQEIDLRRKAATAALATLEAMGTPESAANAKNIAKWLPLNAALTWDEQKRGAVSPDDVGGAGSTVEKPGVLKIETRLAQYNKPYADALAAAAAHAAVQAAVIAQQQAVQAATNRLLDSPTEATLTALHDEGKISRGTLVRTYKAGDDTGPGTFSVEYKLAGVNRIIVHAHCDAQGQPMTDHPGSPVGAVHWKRVEDGHKQGAQYSHRVPVALRAHLIDPTEAKNNRDANPKLQGT